MEEVENVLSSINSKLTTFQDLYPKSDWSETTQQELIRDFSFHSNKMEGLSMSYGETISFLKTGLLESNKLTKPGSFDDITMLRNHQKALDLIFSHYKEELT